MVDVEEETYCMDMRLPEDGQFDQPWQSTQGSGALVTRAVHVPNRHWAGSAFEV